ncbi:MAG: hypothetical protein ACLTWO_01930 [Blautia massiliensis (ex Durand et al. 2017)]
MFYAVRCLHYTTGQTVLFAAGRGNPKISGKDCKSPPGGHAAPKRLKKASFFAKKEAKKFQTGLTAVGSAAKNVPTGGRAAGGGR